MGSSSGAQEATSWQKLLQGHLPAHHSAHTQDFSPVILLALHLHPLPHGSFVYIGLIP